MENTNESIIKILIRVKPDIESELEKKLITEGVLDSLDIMNLIMELEETFEIEIDPEDVLSENFETVESIVELVKKCKEHA